MPAFVGILTPGKDCPDQRNRCAVHPPSGRGTGGVKPFAVDTGMADGAKVAEGGVRVGSWCMDATGMRPSPRPMD
jgi:hypothetical protein